jgi:hypothetical protein
LIAGGEDSLIEEMRSQLRADRERAARRTLSFPKPLEERQPPPAPPARGLRRLFRRR